MEGNGEGSLLTDELESNMENAKTERAKNRKSETAIWAPRVAIDIGHPQIS